MSMFDDLAAQYSALPSWAQIGIPVAGLGGIAYIALHKGGGATSVVSGPGVSAGASNGGGGNNASTGGSAPPISSSPGGGGTAPSQPGPTVAEPVTIAATYNPWATTASAIATMNIPGGGNTSVEGAFAPGQTLTSGPPPGVSAASWLASPGGPGSITGQLLAQYEYVAANESARPSWMSPDYANQQGHIAALEGTIMQLGPSQFPTTYPMLTAADKAAAQAYYGSTWNTTMTPATQGTPASSPGPTNYSAANAKLYSEYLINVKAGKTTAAAIDYATYLKQGGTSPKA